MVAGTRDSWFDRCEQSLTSQKFKKVVVDRGLGQVRAVHHPKFGYGPYGDILLTLLPDGPNTRVEIRATANVDNVQSLVRSPGRKLIDMFKAGLGDVGNPLADDHSIESSSEAVNSIGDELTRLVALHADGHLDDDEFKAAKRKLLG